MRNKNALRQHSIQDYVPGEEPKEDGYLLLAKWITSITDDTQEETEDFADYAGDGTPSMDVTSVSGAYSVEGTYDSEDEAQALIASKKNMKRVMDVKYGTKSLLLMVKQNGRLLQHSQAL